MPNTSTLSLPEVLTRGVAEILPGALTLAKRMEEGSIKVFLGIDPTGSLLTLGHSVVLRKLQQFAELGHEVILLIGNGTVRIGDPTGRDSTRPVLTDEVIEANFKTWQNQASKILDFSQIKIVHNGDWLDKLTYIDMIKLLSQTTVQQLLERDMFQNRLTQGQPIFGHEIIYPLLQGYDSVAMNVDLEIGGTDQTFNMMMGRQLQRSYNNHEKWVLTTPIIAGTDGRKMSKSYQNFIALTEAPNDMYGKLMAISDEMIVEYFTILTDVPSADIAAIATEMKQGTNPMVFKKQLARTITTFYHDAQAAKTAEAYFESTVQQNEIPQDIPKVTVTAKSLSAVDLVVQLRPELSRTEARRLLEQGGVEQAGKKISANETIVLTSETVIRVGKRQYFKVIVLV